MVDALISVKVGTRLRSTEIVLSLFASEVDGFVGDFALRVPVDVSQLSCFDYGKSCLNFSSFPNSFFALRFDLHLFYVERCSHRPLSLSKAVPAKILSYFKRANLLVFT